MTHEDQTMKECMMTLKPVLAAVLAGLLVASCTAHGQQQVPPPAALPEISERPYWRVFRSHSSHNARFFRNLTSDRVFVHEYNPFPGTLLAQLVRPDGTASMCYLVRKTGNYRSQQDRLTFETHSTGAAKTWEINGKTYRSLIFYQPRTGVVRDEGLLKHKNPHKRKWRINRTGWIQDSWPRVMADGCPEIELPAGMAINEKQTSSRFEELRRQDPDAPIRNFPGSQHTGPGRTGLAASGGKPTTSKEEIEAWMKAQEGNVLLSSLGNGYVFTEGWSENTEIWQIGYDGKVYAFGTVTRKTDSSGQEWRISEIPGVGTIYYPIGYPVPLLSTGHRYPAWQLTDELIGGGEPVALPWMGERYADYRFLFHDKTLTIIAPGEQYFTGRWRWTKGRLQVTVDGEEEHAQSIAWPDLARELGVTPRMWTLLTPNTR